MATSKSLASIRGKITNEAPLNKKYTEDELFKFSNWVEGGDTKAIASDLSKRGLLNATQLYVDSPNTSIKGGVQNAQSDWKPAAIQQILMKARAAGMKNLMDIKANKEYLTSGNFKDALNHPTFNQIHPNFWDVVGGIYKDQLSKENAPASLIVKK